MSPPPGRPKAGSALQAAAPRDAALPRSVHARAGGHGAADLSPSGDSAQREGAPMSPPPGRPKAGWHCARHSMRRQGAIR